MAFVINWTPLSVPTETNADVKIGRSALAFQSGYLVEVIQSCHIMLKLFFSHHTPL